MTTILIFIIVISILIFVHEFGHLIAAKWSGIKVEEFAIGMGPRLITLGNDGETDYTLNLLPIGGFCRMQGEVEGMIGEEITDETRSFHTKSPLTKAFVLVAGITMNFILGFILIAVVLAVNGKPNVQMTGFEITSVNTDSPAQNAGLISGNVIIGYKDANDTDYLTNFDLDSFSGFISQKKGQLVTLEIKETNQADAPTHSTEVTPRENPPAGEGALGISFVQNYIIEYARLPWYQIPIDSFTTSVNLSTEIAKGFAEMIKNLVLQHRVPTDIAGPIGVAKLTGEAAQAGVIPLLQLVALISLNLAFVNILPFPALDGGRLAFVIFEGIFRKKLAPKYEGWIHLAGFVILLGLILIISFNDIRTFF